MNSTPLRFAVLIGEGLGADYWHFTQMLLRNLQIEIDPVEITVFRDDKGFLLPSVVQTFQKERLGIKGPTATENGGGAPSANVALRQALDLYVNQRSISWIPGVHTNFTKPELINTTIFRENTEDVYAGIEWAAGSEDAERLREFLINKMGVPAEKLPHDMTGLGIKTTSKFASERLMHYAVQWMLKHGGENLAVMNKGNIMKYTEGFFKECCFEVAKTYQACWGTAIGRTDRRSLHINSVTADDMFQQPILYPAKYQGVVCQNLNGDYFSDMLAALVGGVTLSSGANIGDNCAVFEAIGGTGDNLVGKNIANPAAYFKAVADMFAHANYTNEAKLINTGISTVLKKGHGTADICSDNPLSTEDFTIAVSEAASEMVS